MNLTEYDYIVINTSGGKDSQVMLDVVVNLARIQGVEDRLLAVHADLKRMEWPGTPELAQAQVDLYGVPFVKVTRPQGDLLDQVESRGMWPSSAARYCTAHHKQNQVFKVFTRIVGELRDRMGTPRPVKILNCMGLRAQESPARAKKPAFRFNEAASNGKREVYDWLPILHWTIDEVWERIRETGVPYHPIYDAGMPRLSCCFCVLASKSALIRAAQLAPDLAAEYARVEEKIGHTFQHGRSMAQIIEEARATETVAVADWNA
jgi:3'-phosphoadenosine 5'-phosphosulfate sulfotransferase (PAPS reductase)/FAD synthetase